MKSIYCVLLVAATLVVSPISTWAADEQSDDIIAESAGQSDDGFVIVDEELEAANNALKAAEADLVNKLATQEKARIAADRLETQPAANNNEDVDALDIQASLDKERKILEKLKQGSEPANNNSTTPESVISEENQLDQQALNQVKEEELEALKKEQASLAEQLMSKSASLNSLESSKHHLAKKLAESEAKVAKLIKELKKAQDRLILAETEVERLASILETKHKQRLSHYTKAEKASSANTTELESARAAINHKTSSDMPIATVIVEKANLRAGPGKDNSPLMTVSRGTRLVVETRKGTWYRVVTPTAKRAWISSEVVAFGTNPDASPSRTVEIRGFDQSIEDEAFELIKSYAK